MKVLGFLAIIKISAKPCALFSSALKLAVCSFDRMLFNAKTLRTQRFAEDYFYKNILDLVNFNKLLLILICEDY